MPIGGFVVSIDMSEAEFALDAIKAFPQVDVHGCDDDGNVVVVIDTETGDEMDALTAEIQKIPAVLQVGLTYFHAEDEIEKIEAGEITPNLSRGRKHEKQQADDS